MQRRNTLGTALIACAQPSVQRRGLKTAFDHVLILGEWHLRRTLKSHSLYYNETRTHLDWTRTLPYPAQCSEPEPLSALQSSQAYTTATFGHDFREAHWVQAMVSAGLGMTARVPADLARHRNAARGGAGGVSADQPCDGGGPEALHTVGHAVRTAQSFDWTSGNSNSRK